MHHRTAEGYLVPCTTMEISREQMTITRIDQRIRVEFTGRVLAVRKVDCIDRSHYEVDMVAEDGNV